MIEGSVKEKFQRLVGESDFITDREAMTPFLQEPRNLFDGVTPLILFPRSTEQVSNIMKLAQKTRTAIVPQGGNTGLVGGQQPSEEFPAVLLSLSKLNKIRSFDCTSNIVIAEAGVVLQDLQRASMEHDRLFPLALGSQGSCQIGGNLSTNAGGTGVLAYGNARELCLGLEVVLPDGRILDDLRFVKKDNSGYDLKDLFIGAEGTLGVITAASLKLFPLPKGRAVAFVGLSHPKAAVNLFSLMLDQVDRQLTGFELLPKFGLKLALNLHADIHLPFASAHQWFVLVEITSMTDSETASKTLELLLSDALNLGVIEDAFIAMNEEQEERFWRLREDMSPAQRLAGASIKHDISVPISAIAEFIDEARSFIENLLPDARIVCFGHIGDGNLHYNVSQPESMTAEDFLNYRAEINHHIHKLAKQYHGTFSAEHGIGQLKRSELTKFKSEVAIDLMAAFKNVLDPYNLMNPGKIFLR